MCCPSEVVSFAYRLFVESLRRSQAEHGLLADRTERDTVRNAQQTIATATRKATEAARRLAVATVNNDFSAQTNALNHIVLAQGQIEHAHDALFVVESANAMMRQHDLQRRIAVFLRRHGTDDFAHSTEAISDVTLAAARVFAQHRSMSSNTHASVMHTLHPRHDAERGSARDPVATALQFAQAEIGRAAVGTHVSVDEMQSRLHRLATSARESVGAGAIDQSTASAPPIRDRPPAPSSYQLLPAPSTAHAAQAIGATAHATTTSVATTTTTTTPAVTATARPSRAAEAAAHTATALPSRAAEAAVRSTSTATALPSNAGAAEIATSEAAARMMATAAASAPSPATDVASNAAADVGAHVVPPASQLLQQPDLASLPTARRIGVSVPAAARVEAPRTGDGGGGGDDDDDPHSAGLLTSETLASVPAPTVADESAASPSV